jgi:hypothetical protein
MFTGFIWLRMGGGGGGGEEEKGGGGKIKGEEHDRTVL